MYKITMGMIAAWLIASSATAEPFQSFVDTCLAADADAQAVATLAKNDWFAMPAGTAPDMGKDFRDPVIYLSFDPNSMKQAAPEAFDILVTGWGDGETILKTDRLRLDACGLMSSEADSRALVGNVAAYLGFPPSTKDSMTLWLFSRKPDGFASEAALMDAEDDALLTVTKKRKLYALYVIDEGDMAGLFLGAIRPQP